MSKKVSVNATNAPIKAVLDQIFVGQNVSYAINGHSIIISKKSDTSQQKPGEKKKQTITGIVYDEEGNPVIGASVMNKETARSNYRSGWKVFFRSFHTLNNRNFVRRL